MTPIATRRMTSVLVILEVFAMLASPATLEAATTPGSTEYDKQESEIPTKPIAPPPIPSAAPKDTFRCTRYFMWKGKQFECDSFVRQDAEQLRPIMADVPQAVSELNDYQATRASLHNAAYIGTAGLFLAILGLVLHPRYSDTAPAGQNITRGLTFIGLGATTGALIYSLGTIQANEQRLGSAIHYYNSAHPETPIELQFSTGFAF
jgi:hypothetical protein